MIQFLLWTSIGQTWIAHKAAGILGERLNTTVTVEKIDISFFKFIKLKKVYIEDLNKDTLLFVESLNAEISHWNYENDSLNITLDKIAVTSPIYHLHQNLGDSVTSLTRVFQNLSSKNTPTSNLNIEIEVSRISIDNGSFEWNNENVEKTPFGVNWSHLGLKGLEIDFYDFQMINDSFNAEINHLSGIDTSGFVLNHLSGKTIFSSTTTLITDLELVTPYSNIKGNIHYQYDSVSAYASFIDHVYMRYTIDSSIINVKDISYFAPALEGLDYELLVHGKERGPVSDMKFQDIFISYGDASVLNGRIFITGLPHLEETSFNCKFKQLSSSQTDLTTIKTYPFTSGETISVPEFLKNAKQIDFVGRFNGFYYDFVTYGKFTSANGSVSTDLQLSQNENNDIYYDGKITTENFNLAQLTNKPKLFDKASIDIDIKGKGLDFKCIELNVAGDASAFDFMGYRYKDINIDASISKKVIAGILNVADTNVNLAFNGRIDLSDNVPKYEFVSTIEHLKPKQLHLMERDSTASLSSKVTLNFQGSNLDNILGSAKLENFHFEENGEEVDLQKVDFIAYTIGEDKMLSLRSENLDLQINGKFLFIDILPSLNHVIYPWLPSIYAKKPQKPSTVQNFELILKAHEFSGFSSIFVPQVTFEKDLFIDLKFNSEAQEIIIESNSTKMNILGQGVANLNLNATLSLDTFDLHTSAKKVLFTDSNYVENVEIKATAIEDLIKSNITWNNDNTEGDDAGSLNFDIEFTNPENFKIYSYQSWFNFNDTLWTIHDSGLVSKNKKEYEFKNVLFSQNAQDISIDGFISEDPEKELVIDIDSLSLSILNPIINKYNLESSGSAAGTTHLFDFYNEFQLHSNTLFTDLVINQQSIGDGLLQSIWNSELEKFEVNINFHEEELERINLNGAYYPKKSKNQLDLNLRLNQFPIKIIEPFTVGIIDHIKGTVTGNAKITGQLSKPKIDGDFVLNHIETRVIYLNETLYTNDQHVFIRPNLIGADAIIISDASRKKAEVNFSLFHQNFAKINYDVAINSIDIFRAFNTSKIDNKYFYGQVYLNPESSIGIESNYQGDVSINANINSGPETFVTIPFYEDDEVSQRDYIFFKSDKNTSDTLSEESFQHEESFGLNLDMTLNLDKNAEVQLIFDEFTNDKIQATGNGSINLKINKNGDFNIYGTYEIVNGFYLFTFSKVISKKFKIKPGGKLTWNGDPYSGKADIDASYKVRTSLVDLQIYASADSTARIPVEVILHMSGNYMNPDLGFSFLLPPKYEEVETLLNSLDVGAKNKQVFALLILNKFLPISNNDVSSGSSVIGTNSTEVLSNQLSNWLSKISNDFDVGVRYSPGAETTASEVELALSTQIFDDRVLIETNVGITTDNPSQTATNANNFVGEFTVSYKVNRKGNIVGKVFQRSNELNPVYVNTSPYTQGVGLAYTEPFKNGDNLGCIISNHFKKPDFKRDCEKEYYQQQIDQKDENLDEILNKVEKSRATQKERNQKKLERDIKVARKKE
ncbi:MAG: hypothetical protein ACJA2N_000458 [Salibacteraceae bacterium]